MQQAQAVHQGVHLVVQKYGGTSVGTPERIRRVAERIRDTRAKGVKLVVVVSAMGHTTDQLLELAAQVSEAPPEREIDMLLSTGERISMALLSMALSDLGVDAVSLTGSQVGIITTTHHRRARIKRILGDRVREALARDKVVIVAGFQGVSEAKEITTLGRGGSDTTAVALAAALQADRCEIFTDVDGVYSTNPALVPDAQVYKEVSAKWMLEMASRGAQVLHPRAVEIGRHYSVPIWVLNSLKPGNIGTLVTEKVSMENQRVVGVTVAMEKCLLQLELARPTTLMSVWETLNGANLELMAPQFSETALQCFLERDQLNDVRRTIQRLEEDEFVSSHLLREDIVPVSIVGEALLSDQAVLGQIVDALGKDQIAVAMGVSSPIAITLGVPKSRADDAVRVLHDRFVSHVA